MPSYYSGRPLGGQLPLTPPDSGSGYGSFRTVHYSQDPYATQQGHHKGSYDFQSAYMQPIAAPASTYQYQQSNYSCNSLPPIQSSFYESSGTQNLPPLRINERSAVGDEHQRQLQQEQSAAASVASSAAAAAASAREQQQRQAPKEEKATGGVSAKLDYEMERMTDFVTEAAQSIFQHQMQAQPSFRKWVHQVLSATRLPSATILLSLHYLNDRLAKHPSSVSAGETQIYRLLAVALVLGSKFLDDNTFINRSWSDVTAIKVLELNVLEMQWLKLIEYQLHIEPQCLQAWIDSWKKYDSEYGAKHQPTRLSPLDTNVHRHTRQADRYSPYPTPQTATANTFDSAALSARSMPYAPTYSSNDMWAAVPSADRRALDEYHGKSFNSQRYPGYDSHHEDVTSSGRYPTQQQSSAYDYPRSAESNARLALEDYHHSRAAAAAAAGAYVYPHSAHPSYYPSGMTPYLNAWDQKRNWSSSTTLSAAGSAAAMSSSSSSSALGHHAHHRYDCTCTACAYQAHYRPYATMGSSYGTAVQSVMG